jgi:hypothetical protein
MLAQIHHPYSSKKNEALNKAIMKVAPKHQTFCLTMSLSDRVNFVLITDSLGYASGINRIMKTITGDKGYSMNPVSQVYWQRVDAFKEKARIRQRSPAIKKQRAKQKSEAIRQGLLQQKHDAEKGETYGTGIALEEKVTTGRKRKAKRISSDNKKNNEKSMCCPHCKGKDHMRRSFAACPANKKNARTESTTATVIPVSAEKSTAEVENQGKWAGSKIVPM